MLSLDVKNKFMEALSMIRDSECIVLAGHTSPDGDSIGTLLAMSNAIKENLDKKIIAYSTDAVPSSLEFLYGTGNLTSEIDWYPDLIIGFDYGDFERLNLPENKIQGARMITFDHHPISSQRGDLRIIETEISSTAELVYEFLKSVGWQISKNTAICLLTGIITDTGAFAHKTSAHTLKNVGELVSYGAPLGAIYTKTFADKTPQALNIWGAFLKNVTIHPEYKFIATYVPYAEFSKYGIVLEDLTGFVSILNLVQDAKFSIFAVEYEDGRIKGSLRSDKFKDFDVERIAKELGGGGHKYASGFTFEGSIEELEKEVLKVVEKYTQ